MANVKITSKGIRKVLRNYNPRLAVAEYIWNGFDAGANTLHLHYECDELDNVSRISITDNGKGIPHDKLQVKFNPFYDSEKAVEVTAPKHTSVMHGKNGVGRLTFFTFAHKATWISTSLKHEALSSCEIRISVDGLNTYQVQELPVHVQAYCGTTVTFYDVQLSRQEMETSVIPFLITEFCWFLELNKDKEYRIIINGAPLDYSGNILEAEEDLVFHYEESDTVFKVKYVQWKQPLHNELSKFYFSNGEGNEVYKDYTTLNKKSDEFYHSLYIQSPFFNDFDFQAAENSLQGSLWGQAKSSPEYKFLVRKLSEYLREKRKPFLKRYAVRLTEQFRKEAVLPVYASDWEQQQKTPQLEAILTGLYEVQPRLFSSLNTEQKKTFVQLLDLLLDSDQGGGLAAIVDGAMEPDPEERAAFSQLVKKACDDRKKASAKIRAHHDHQLAQ